MGFQAFVRFPLLTNGTRLRMPYNGARAFSMCDRPSPVKVASSRSFRSRIPNLLTWARVAAIPALTASGLVPVFQGQRVLTCGLFVAAALTDWVDGFLARRWNVATRFGAFLDPVADKLIVAAALVIVARRFASASVAPVLVVSAIVILSREIFVSALREWMATAMAGGRDKVKVGFAGKMKTAMQMIALSILLAVETVTSPLGLVGTVFLAVAAVLAVYSGLNYLRAAMPSFEDSSNGT